MLAMASVESRLSWSLIPGLALIGGIFLCTAGTGGAGSAGGTETDPFSLGETLVYHIEWSPPWYLFFLPAMDAGEVSLMIAEGPEVEKRPSLRIVFTAKSSGTLAKLVGVNIDDYFESDTDPQTFCTFAVRQKIREGTRKRDIEVVYLPGSNQLHIRQLNVAINPPKVDRNEYLDDVPSCVRDIFSALYDTRRQDLKAGVTHRLLVGYDDKVREIAARVDKKEVVKTPLGKFDAWKVDTIAVLGGLFKDGGQLRIWMTADQRKLPVRFEVKVGLGKVTGALKKLTAPAAADAGRSQR